MCNTAENALKTAHEIVGWLFDEGIVSPDDDVMEPAKMEAYIADIITKGCPPIPTVTIDEIDEEKFHDFNERLRFDW